MTRPPLPGRDQVLAALDHLRSEAEATGRQPAVLTLARSLGLANTTFRRNFPDIVAELTQQAGGQMQNQPLPAAPGNQHPTPPR